MFSCDKTSEGDTVPLHSIAADSYEKIQLVQAEEQISLNDDRLLQENKEIQP